jgi:hypothetical protein
MTYGPSPNCLTAPDTTLTNIGDSSNPLDQSSTTSVQQMDALPHNATMYRRALTGPMVRGAVLAQYMPSMQRSKGKLRQDIRLQIHQQQWLDNHRNRQQQGQQQPPNWAHSQFKNLHPLPILLLVVEKMCGLIQAVLIFLHIIKQQQQQQQQPPQAAANGRPRARRRNLGEILAEWNALHRLAAEKGLLPSGQA